MKPWVEKTLKVLASSLEPPCSEPNELDWKVDLSSDSKRLGEHLMAFANHPGGGTFVFGLDRIEIFSDRIEISNPGRLLPSKSIERIIGTMPESRNERLTSAFFLYKICERRGSGLMRAGEQVEFFGLPPIKFEEDAHHFKVTLFAPQTFAQMAPADRLNACYQHALLRLCSNLKMTNKSLRERLKMPERQRSMVSRLIQEAVDKGLIAPADPYNTSRRHTEYVPAWAAPEISLAATSTN